MRPLFYGLIFIFLVAASTASFGSDRPQNWHADKQAPSNIPKLPPVVTTFDIYVGGLHFLTADILFEEQKDSYLTRMHAHTAGYLYKILKWDGNVSSTGRIKGDHLEPIVYSNLDTWQDKPKVTKLMFDKKGDIQAEFNPPNTDKNREPVTDEQKRGALDPVTALLQMLANVAVNQTCTGTVPVFDGKRRFDLVGEDHGLELVDDKDYGTYKGPARNCSVDFTMVAGEWKDREKNRFWERENGEQGRAAFHIWLASVASDLPALPVRLESTSVFGDIVAHLSSWHYATSDELKP